MTPLGDPLGPPDLVITPSAIDLLLQKGETADVPIRIKNAGGFTLRIKSMASEQPWIFLQDTAFQHVLEAADSIEIFLTIGQSALQAGSFEGFLKIISNDDDVEDSESFLKIELEVTEEVLAFEPTLSKIQSKVFSFTCTECHDSGNPSEGLDLTPGNSHSNLANRRSNQVPELFLVEPFNPDPSYLIRKLEGGPDIVEKRMPLDQPPLSQAHIRVVRVWISQGAQEN